MGKVCKTWGRFCFFLRNSYRKNRTVLKILIIILALGICCDLRADTIYLKNGRSIEGVVRNNTEVTVELEVCSGSVKFSKPEVDKIIKSSALEIEAIHKKCEKQKIDTEARMLEQKIAEESKPVKADFVKDEQGIILEVKLNKKVDATLILDTGASLTVLRKDMAKKLGINTDKVVPDVKLVVADGRQINAKHIVLSSVKVQHSEAENVDAAVMLEETSSIGAYDGLLGMSFLRLFNFKIDQEKKKLVLEKI